MAPYAIASGDRRVHNSTHLRVAASRAFISSCKRKGEGRGWCRQANAAHKLLIREVWSRDSLVETPLKPFLRGAFFFSLSLFNPNYPLPPAAFSVSRSLLFSFLICMERSRALFPVAHNSILHLCLTLEKEAFSIYRSRLLLCYFLDLYYL